MHFQQFVTTICQNCINNKCDALKTCGKFMMKFQSWDEN